MKNIGRLVSILWILCLIVSCNKNQNQEYQEQYIIGFSQGIWSHPFRYEMNEALKVESSLYDDLELIIRISDADAQKQIEHVQELIKLGVDALIISPTDEKSLVPSIEKAIQNDIPVILVDRKLESDSYSVFVGADNLQIGRTAANRIISRRNQKNVIVEFFVDDNASPSIERRVGFRQVIDRDPNSIIIKSFAFNDMNGFSQFLKSDLGKEVNYIYAFNDFIAYQAYQIARLNGLESEIKFIGIDGLNVPEGGIDLVRRGILDASILYPNGSKEAIEAAYNILKGKEVPKTIVLTSTVIDSSNAEIMSNQFSKISEQQSLIENQNNSIDALGLQFRSQTNLLRLSMILSIILVVLAFYSFYSFFLIRNKNWALTQNNQRINIQRAQLEEKNKQVRESNDAKLNFFTGLSHEFKTPLTLIISSIESLASNKDALSKKWSNELELIHSNSNRLLRIINQLLDFRKVEERSFNVKVSETNLTLFTQGIFKDFDREAKKRSISFNLTTTDTEIKIFFDRNLLDKVFFNLISNAFKFTPDNGKIDIEIKNEENDSFITIDIRDNGISIPQIDESNVFKPFFKASNNRRKSSGIGLYLSKQIIDAHKGEISYQPLKNGSLFRVKLLKGNAHFDSDEIIFQSEIIDSELYDFDTGLDSIDYKESEVLNGDERHKVLIVEDNVELLNFLSKKLSTNYEVYTDSGLDVINKVLEIIPDFILCDVNLPEQSGFELCKIIKNDFRTSHIPIIILTALGDNESFAQGLGAGADLYLTKPFSFAVLNQAITSLLYNRSRLRYYYTSNSHLINYGVEGENTDKLFIQKMNEIINNNIENSAFTVEDLAIDLDLSRVQLYRKVKAIIGIGINEYINLQRFEKARSLLISSGLTIAEIAYSCGFSSSNYFVTSFKKHFSVTPAQYRRENK